MSTREKLAKIEYNEDSFVTLYQEEIDKIEDYEKDLMLFDELEDAQKREVELDARSYYRKFARFFLEVSGDRVSKEEAMPICQRFDELCEEFQNIEEIEKEKQEIEQKIHIQDLEDAQLREKIRSYHEQVNNRHVLWVSTSIMLIIAVILTLFAMGYYHILLSKILLPGLLVIFVAAMVIFWFYKGHKKALEKEKLYGIMKTNRRIVSNRIQMEYESCCRRLGFYYEKYDTIFSYIQPEQWKLFGFCAKVLEGIESEELQSEREQLEDSLKTYQFQHPKMWLFYTRALYDMRKREELVSQWKERKNSCFEGIKKHTKNEDRGEEDE